MKDNKGIYYTCPKIEKEESNIFVCKTLRLMNYLVRKGFECKKVKPDNQNPKYVVFCFDDCKELRDVLDNYEGFKNK